MVEHLLPPDYEAALTKLIGSDDALRTLMYIRDNELYE